MNKGKIHLVIGDTQLKPGVPANHMGWIGRYIVDQFAGQDLRIIHVGDNWDMPSLSSYDKGKRGMEGRRYLADIKAGNAGIVALDRATVRYNRGRRRASQWHPRKHFFLGNHEARIARACEDDAQLDGVIGYHHFNLKEQGWKVHPFLEPAVFDGVTYAHYFYNPNTGRPYAGQNVDTRLKTIGHSFTMGHQQGIRYGVREVATSRHHGLINGSCYLHAEGYLGPQGNNPWRGIVVCHQVERGQYDPMFVSLDYLCRRYEGMRLKAFLRTIKTTE